MQEIEPKSPKNRNTTAATTRIRERVRESYRGSVPFSKLIPNIITLIGLMFGVSSIRFALESKWEFAAYFIVAAALIDGLDGRIARLLDASSPFGAELDSLCDLVNFGVCPAIIIYLWSFQMYEFRVLSWSAILLYVLCMAIRLARFNTTSPDTDNTLSKNYFTGVPAPAGAILALMPMIMDFELSEYFGITIRNHTLLINIYTVIIALLLPSRLSTFSAKNFKINAKYLYLSMTITGIIIVYLSIYTWQAISILAILYLASIPYTEYKSRELLE